MTSPAPQEQSGAFVFDGAKLVVQNPEFLAYDWLIHGSTTRQMLEPGRPRYEELQQIQTHFHLANYPIVYARQVHKNHVGEVTPDVAEAARHYGHFIFADTDAIVCAMPGVTIAVVTADCAPILVVDPVTRHVAAIHAGWAGTLARISEVAVQRMVALGSRTSDLVAWIGPMACGRCYEVSPEMIAQFREGFADALDTGCQFHEGRLLDLAALDQFQLMKAGLRAENVFDSALCTLERTNQFYSYRREGKAAGRIVSFLTVIP